MEQRTAHYWNTATRYRTQQIHGLLNAVRWIIIVVVPADHDFTLGELIETIALRTNGQLLTLRKSDVANILEARLLKYITDLVSAII